VRLNLGCADRHKEGFVNVDICAPADQIADLTQPWPWSDSSVHEVIAEDIFEHLPNKIHTMNELWRVLCHGGMATIVVPDGCGPGQHQDPDHKSAWVMNSFQYWQHESFAFGRLAKAYGIKGAFRIISLTKQNYRDTYEPVPKITAVLEAVKS
jgi:predicted SAM-dependent methyltransferase